MKIEFVFDSLNPFKLPFNSCWLALLLGSSIFLNNGVLLTAVFLRKYDLILSYLSAQSLSLHHKQFCLAYK